MDNQLKPITKTTISELNKAKISSIMATGDNIHTAICVAKKCGILHRQNRTVFSHQIDSSSK